MTMLSKDELDRLLPAASNSLQSPVPTQVVSSDEFLPIPQTERQKKVEARMNALADELRQEERPVAPALLPDRRRHGDGLRRHERGLRPALRRLAGRGEERRPRPGARRRR